MSQAQLKLSASGKRAKSKRGQRALDAKAPKVTENIKSAMFLRGTTSSDIVNSALRDLGILKKPNAVLLQKKNKKRPFEDDTEINFLSEKNDCSLFAYGSHSKKRPNQLTMGRFYNHNVLDMMELNITRFVPMENFDANKTAPALGSKPCFIFKGVDFEYKDDCRKFSNLMLDFFRGMVVDQINLEGLDHVIVCTALEGTIYWRHYAIILKRVQGSNLPLVHLEEVGPSIDFQIGRTRFADKDLLKEACRVPSEKKGKKQKNVTTTAFATMGTVHKGTQDFSDLQTRKIKGLKRKRERDAEGSAAANGDAASAGQGGQEEESAGGAAGEATSAATTPKKSPKKPRN